MNQKNNKRPQILANENIKYDTLRVSMPDGESLIMSRRDALSHASRLELDLVLIAENAEPPVAKLTSLNKHLYDIKQKAKEAKKKQRTSFTETKEIRMGLNIDTHDLETKVRNAKKFLEKKNAVVITIQLRGRERGKQDMARQLLAKFAELSQAQLGNVSFNGNRISAKLNV